MSYTRLGCIANASPKANRAVARHHQPSPQLIGSALPRPAFKLQKLTMDLISQVRVVERYRSACSSRLADATWPARCRCSAHSLSVARRPDTPAQWALFARADEQLHRHAAQQPADAGNNSARRFIVHLGSMHAPPSPCTDTESHFFPHPAQPQIKAEDKNELAHTKALQALSNEHDVPYQATLRVVTVDGSKEPLLPPRQTRKHPVCACHWLCGSEPGCSSVDRTSRRGSNIPAVVDLG